MSTDKTKVITLEFDEKFSSWRRVRREYTVADDFDESDVDTTNELAGGSDFFSSENLKDYESDLQTDGEVEGVEVIL
jgi:hypothetical protein